MTERQRRSRFIYRGLGFPVIIERVCVSRIRGALVPDVDPDELERRVRLELVRKKSRLSGSEVRFARHSFGLTVEKFARRLGVTHPAVLKWESRGNGPTRMTWSTEKDLRLWIFSRGYPTSRAFLEMYHALVKNPGLKEAHVRVRF